MVLLARSTSPPPLTLLLLLLLLILLLLLPLLARARESCCSNCSNWFKSANLQSSLISAFALQTLMKSAAETCLLLVNGKCSTPDFSSHVSVVSAFANAVPPLSGASSGGGRRRCPLLCPVKGAHNFKQPSHTAFI